MIDWLTVSLPYDGRFVGEKYFKANPDKGLFEPAYTIPERMKGSYSSTISVIAVGGTIKINGNPVKYFTGQNVVGTNDIKALVDFTVRHVFERLGEPIPEVTEKALQDGSGILHRVDCTFAFRVGSTEDVRNWLVAMGSCCNVRYRGRGHYDDGMATLMFGLSIEPGKKPKASRYSTFKFYCKETEIKKRPLLCLDQYKERLMNLARGHVRAEALYRRQELSLLNLDRVSQWDITTPQKLNRAWIDKMEISPNVELEDRAMLDLPSALRSTYLHWLQGEDLRNLLTRATFYRHRKALLDHDVDIAGPAPKRREVHVVPVVQVLVARPSCIDFEADFWRMARHAA